MIKANASDIHRILAEDTEQVLKQISVENFDVSLPLDGKGTRILVRVQKGFAKELPKKIIVERDGQVYEVPLEISETYLDFNSQ